MHTEEDQHPDYLSDKRRFDSTVRGGRQYIEDLALRAYFAILDNGGTKQQAEDSFFNVFKNEN